MPLKIQNYGEWEGDKPGGYHPPACTCVKCNEERRQLEASQEEERRVKEYDRRVAGRGMQLASTAARAGNSRRGRTTGQVTHVRGKRRGRRWFSRLRLAFGLVVVLAVAGVIVNSIVPVGDIGAGLAANIGGWYQDVKIQEQPPPPPPPAASPPGR